MRGNATRFNRILLLTDLTDKSQSALGFARAFADFYDSCLFVLHVLPQPEPGSPSLGFHGEDKHAAEIARARLEAVGKALRDEGISVQVRLCRGTVTARTILKNIRAIRPDLII